MSAMDSNEDWIKDYELRKNKDGKIDLILPKREKEKGSIRLEAYQVDYLKKNYPERTFSESLRLALIDLIKFKNNVDNIVIITEEIH